MTSTSDNRPTVIERALLDALLTGDHPVLSQLRDQEKVVTVEERHWSLSGCTAELHVPRTSVPVRPASINLADVGFRLRGAENPGHAILFVKDGFLAAIEYYNWTDDWPQTPQLENVHFYIPYDAKEPLESAERDHKGVANELAA